MTIHREQCFRQITGHIGVEFLGILKVKYDKRGSKCGSDQIGAFYKAIGSEIYPDCKHEGMAAWNRILRSS